MVPDDLIIGVNSIENSMGYKLMKAMGFKDRGHSKFCFKSYESGGEDEGFNYDENELEF